MTPEPTPAPEPTVEPSLGPVEECVPHSVLMCINGLSSYWPRCDSSQGKMNTGPGGYEFGDFCTSEWASALNAMLSDPVVGKCGDATAIRKLLAQIAYETGYFATVYQPADGGAGFIHMTLGNWEINAVDMDALWPGRHYVERAQAMGKDFFQVPEFGWLSVAAWFKRTNRVISYCNIDLFEHSFLEQTRCILSSANNRQEAFNIVGECLAAPTRPPTKAPTSSSTFLALTPTPTEAPAPAPSRSPNFLAPMRTPTALPTKVPTMDAPTEAPAKVTKAPTSASTSEEMTCVATPGLYRGVSDADCQKCVDGVATWPCNKDHLCTCSTGISPAPTHALMTCYAAPDLILGVSNAACQPCEHGYPYWPCSEAGLCLCIMNSFR